MSIWGAIFSKFHCFDVWHFPLMSINKWGNLSDTCSREPVTGYKNHWFSFRWKSCSPDDCLQTISVCAKRKALIKELSHTCIISKLPAVAGSTQTHPVTNHVDMLILLLEFHKQFPISTSWDRFTFKAVREAKPKDTTSNPRLIWHLSNWYRQKKKQWINKKNKKLKQKEHYHSFRNILHPPQACWISSQGQMLKWENYRELFYSGCLPPLV